MRSSNRNAPTRPLARPTLAPSVARAQRPRRDAGLAPAAVPQGLHHDRVQRQQGADLQLADQPHERGRHFQPGPSGRLDLQGGTRGQVQERAGHEAARRRASQGAAEEPGGRWQFLRGHWQGHWQVLHGGLRPSAVAAARETQDVPGRPRTGPRNGLRLRPRPGPRNGPRLGPRPGPAPRAGKRDAPQALRERRRRLRCGKHAQIHKGHRRLAQGHGPLLGPDTGADRAALRPDPPATQAQVHHERHQLRRSRTRAQGLPHRFGSARRHALLRLHQKGLSRRPARELLRGPAPGRVLRPG